MKKYVRAESLVDTFLKYHDDESNWSSNRNGFEKMYKILDKYDDSNGNDTVDVAFNKATLEDQKRMIELITPERKVGVPGYCKAMYRKAVNRDYEDPSYIDGILDAFDALFREGFLDKSDF